MRFQRVGLFWLPSAWLRDDWLLSPLTVKLFFFSALCVLALVPAVMRADEAHVAPWIRTSLTALGFLVPIGVLFLFIGMWWYWVRLDKSRAWQKKVWFVILLFGFWWGSFLYYFIVYLPQVLRTKKVEA
jgi:hypothetical protein